MVEMNSPLAVAYHEAGHAAIVYWRRQRGGSIVLHTDRFGGSMNAQLWNMNESDLMVLIGGPMAECLARGIVSLRALRVPSEYRHPNSDTVRIRAIVQKVRGKDDRRYQFRVQERVREIIQEPVMWKAITALAEKLVAAGRVEGEDVDVTFEALGAPVWDFGPILEAEEVKSAALRAAKGELQ